MQSGILKTFKLDFVWSTLGPFLFCVHHKDNYPAGQDFLGPKKELLKGRKIGNDFTLKDGWRMYHGEKVPGFPSHPHRGFETITVVTKGFVDHSDSLGACGRFGGGDVQWMTAGKGIQHAEMFPLLNQNEENPAEFFQIWINLPKEKKMSEPNFTMLWKEKIAKVKSDDGKTIITVVADTANLLIKESQPTPPDSWASYSDTAIGVWVLDMEEGAEFEIPVNKDNKINRNLYYFEGDGVSLNDEKNLSSGFGVNLVSDYRVTIKNGNSKSRLLLLQGRPIGEPVAQQGPFVMNTSQELMQAYFDYQKTEFGGWPWPHGSPVHPIDKGRFAKFSNGDEIFPE